MLQDLQRVKVEKTANIPALLCHWQRCHKVVTPFTDPEFPPSIFSIFPGGVPLDIDDAARASAEGAAKLSGLVLQLRNRTNASWGSLGKGKLKGKLTKAAAERPWLWQRASVLLDWGVLYHNGHRSIEAVDHTECVRMQNIAPVDVMQGAIGDCWIMAAISALAEQPARVMALFSEKKTNASGKYHVRLQQMGIWHNSECTTGLLRALQS